MSCSGSGGVVACAPEVVAVVTYICKLEGEEEETCTCRVVGEETSTCRASCVVAAVETCGLAVVSGALVVVVEI
ncbi:TPA: hypothetical protein PVC72_004805, partial [Escherichia coli]|nr:hypothetical protein [Escherichia coli]